MARRFYSSTAAPTTLTGPVNSSSGTFVVGATTGFPGSFPYTLIVDPDTASEEVVQVTAASGTTLTVTRGVDGTAGQSHNAGAVVKHGISARDFDEPNAHIQEGGGDSPHGLPDEVWDLSPSWTSWNPTWGGVTLGNSTVVARYEKVGQTVNFMLRLTIGSTAVFPAGTGSFTLPVSVNGSFPATNAVATHSLSAVPFVARLEGGSMVAVYNPTGGSVLNSGSGLCAAGMVWVFQGTYRSN